MSLSLDERETLIRRIMADTLVQHLKGLRPPTEDELKKAAAIAVAIVEFPYREPTNPRDGISFA